jgi:hypothetical protein
MIPIDIERTRNALQTKYTRTVATNGINAVSYKWSTQAQLNALSDKTTSVLVGNVYAHWDTSVAVNTWAEAYFDFAASAIFLVSRTNLSMQGSQVYAPWGALVEFSDMTYAITGTVAVYKHFIGWKFTFQ